MIDELTAACRSLYDAEPAIQALYQYLGVVRDDNFLTLHRSFSDLEPGRMYDEWAKVNEIATNDPLEDPQRIQLIREGLATKSRERGSELSAEDVDARILELKLAAYSKREAASNLSSEKWPAVQADTQYRRYRVVHSIWSIFGMQEFAERFRRVDQGEGHERRIRGFEFERDNAAVAFHLVCGQLLNEGRLGDPTHASYVTGAEWRDKDARRMGEIDLLLYSNVDAARTVIAIVELKSNFFEIHSGLEQHRKKLTGHLSIVDHEGNYYRLSTTASEVPVFLATMIPENRFLLGAEISIITLLSEHIYNAPKNSSSSKHKLDLNDDECVSRYITFMRTSLDLGPSPAKAIRDV